MSLRYEKQLTCSNVAEQLLYIHTHIHTYYIWNVQWIWLKLYTLTSTCITTFHAEFMIWKYDSHVYIIAILLTIAVVPIVSIIAAATVDWITANLSMLTLLWLADINYYKINKTGITLLLFYCIVIKYRWVKFWPAQWEQLTWKHDPLMLFCCFMEMFTSAFHLPTIMFLIWFVILPLERSC